MAPEPAAGFFCQTERPAAQERSSHVLGGRGRRASDMPAYHPQRIEPKWQAEWERNKTFRAIDLDPSRPKLYILDMFPYPSGAGLHVGHPEGYTATDIVCRYKRMRGFNVLHPMGWDAFGLPAEQYAVQTNTHPRITTQANIDTFRRQIKSLGFSYDWDREVDTTDPDYYKWTQWIFLKLYDTWYDPDFEWTDRTGRRRKGKGRPIAELPIPPGTTDPDAYRDSRRLAYRAVVPVNWCPELGTVLANEEVIDGKSERGGYPGRAHAAHPVDAADHRLRRAAGRGPRGASTGPARSRTCSATGSAAARGPRSISRSSVPDRTPSTIRVYTTRPIRSSARPTWSCARAPARRSDHDRVPSRWRRGLSQGGRRQERPRPHRPGQDQDRRLHRRLCHQPRQRPADPGLDRRLCADGLRHRGDHGRARTRRARLRVCAGIQSADRPRGRAEPGSGGCSLERGRGRAGDLGQFAERATIALDGLPTAEAKVAITGWLEKQGLGKKTVNYKLRDWLFSRQRYWGEPFPVVLDENDRTHAVRRSRSCRSACPSWRTSSRPASPSRRLSKAVRVGPLLRQRPARDQHDAPVGRIVLVLSALSRPHNDKLPWDPEKERYWMPVDLYVGGAEHAVLHLLYSRFWHKVLFDRGLVSTPEPFQKLVNQGMILGETEYTGLSRRGGTLGRPGRERATRRRRGQAERGPGRQEGRGIRSGGRPERPRRRAGSQDVEGARQCDQSRRDRRGIRR